MTNQHRPDCQLLTVPIYGLCTCDFDQRVKADKKSNYRSIGDWVRRGFRDARGLLITPRN